MVGMTLWRGAQGCRESGRRAGRTSAAEHRDARGAADVQDAQVPRSTGMRESGQTR
jgi:hypothetical protein